jgi:hypothetical protein
MPFLFALPARRPVVQLKANRPHWSLQWAALIPVEHSGRAAQERLAVTSPLPPVLAPVGREHE